MDADKLNELKEVVSRMLTDVGVGDDDARSIIENLESYTVENSSIVGDKGLNEGVFIKEANWIEKTKANIGNPSETNVERGFSFRPVYNAEGKINSVSVGSLIKKSENVYIHQGEIIGGFRIPGTTNRWGFSPTEYGGGFSSPNYSQSHINFGSVFTDTNNATIYNFINKEIEKNALGGYTGTDVSFYDPKTMFNKRNSRSAANIAQRNILLEQNKVVSSASFVNTSSSPTKGAFSLDTFHLSYGEKKYGLLGSLDFNQNVKTRFYEDVINNHLGNKTVFTKEELLGKVADAFQNRIFEELDTVFNKGGSKIKDYDSFVNAYNETKASRNGNPFVFSVDQNSVFKIAKEHFEQGEGVATSLKSKLRSGLGFETMRNTYFEHLKTFNSEKFKGFDSFNNLEAKSFSRGLLNDISFGLHSGLALGLKGLQGNLINNGKFSANDLINRSSTYEKILEDLNLKTSSSGKNYVRINTKANGINYAMNLTDLTVEAFDIHTSFAKKTPGLFLLESLEQKEGFTYDKVVQTFNRANDYIKQIQNGNTPKAKTYKDLKGLFGKNGHLFDLAISTGTTFSLTDLNQRRSAIKRGKSSTIGHGITGNLSFLNENKDRAWQYIDSLTDYVKRGADGTLKNITEELVRNKIKTTGSKSVLIDPSMYKNVNLDTYDKLSRHMLNEIDPRKYKDYSSLGSTRGNVNTIAFDIFTAKGEPGLFTFNESGILHQDVSDVLVASKNRVGYISDSKILEKLSPEEKALFERSSRQDKLRFISKQMRTQNIKENGIFLHNNTETLFEKNRIYSDFSKLDPKSFEVLKTEALSGSKYGSYLKNRVELLDNTVKKMKLFDVETVLGRSGNVAYKPYLGAQDLFSNIHRIRDAALSDKFNKIVEERQNVHNEFLEYLQANDLEDIREDHSVAAAEISQRNYDSKRKFLTDSSELIKSYYEDNKYRLNDEVKELKRQLKIFNNPKGKDAESLLKKIILRPDELGINIDSVEYKNYKNASEVYNQYIKEYAYEKYSFNKIKKSERNSFFGNSIKIDYAYSFDEDKPQIDVVDRNNLRFNNVVFDEANDRYVFDFAEVHKAKVSSKLHGESGEKFSVSSVVKKLSVDGREIGIATSSKSLDRQFTGTDINSFIKTALHFSNDKKEFLKSIKSITDDLGLDIAKTEKGYSFNDRSSGLDPNKSMEELADSLRNTVDNPYAKGHFEANRTITALQKKYGHFSNIMSLLNEKYEAIGGERIFGDFKMNIDGHEFNVFGIKKIQNVALSSSHGKGPMKNALQLDDFAAAFLDTKGYSELSHLIKTEGINKLSRFIDQNTAIPANLTSDSKTIEQFFSKIENYKGTLKDGSKFLDFNTGSASDLFNEISGKNLSYSEFENILRQEKYGFGQANIASIFDPSNKHGSFKFDFSGEAFTYLKDQIAIEIGHSKNEMFDEALKLYKEELVNFKGDINGYEYKAKLNALQKTAADASIGDSGFLASIVAKLDGNTSKNSIFKTVQLLTDATKATTLDSSFNSFYKNQTDALGIDGVLRKVTQAKNIQKFMEFDKISKSVVSNTSIKNNSVFMSHLNSYGDLIDSGAKFDNFDRATFNTLLSSFSTSNNNPEIYRNLKETLKTYMYAQKDKKISPELLAKHRTDLRFAYNDAMFAVENGNLTFRKNYMDRTNTNFIKKQVNALFNNDYFEVREATRKGSVFAKQKNLRVDTSISGKPAEGSLFLEQLANKYSDAVKSNDIDAFKKGMNEFFGEQVVDDFFFEGIDLKGNQTDMIYKFRQNVRKLENFSITSVNAMRGNDGGVAAFEFNKSVKGTMEFTGGKVNGFLGMLNRHPHQSAAHFAPTLNFLADKSKSKTNFVQGMITKLGLHESNNGMMIFGKKTALGMYGDFDGDNFYLADFRKFLEKNDGGYGLKEHTFKGIAEIYALRGFKGEELKNKTSTLSGTSLETLNSHSDFFDTIERYADTYNSALQAKLEVNIEKHLDVQQFLFSKKVLEGIASDFAGNVSNPVIAENVFKNAQASFGEHFEHMVSLLGGKKEVLFKLEETLNKGLINRQAIKAYLPKVADTAQVIHTGMVWYEMNTKRNLGQVLGQANTSVDAIKGFYKAELAKNLGKKISEISPKALETGLETILLKAQNKGIINESSWEEMSSKFGSLIDGIKKNNFVFDKTYAEAIESGVIASKHNGETFFGTINNIIQHSFTEKNAFGNVLDDLETAINGSDQQMKDFLTKAGSSNERSYQLAYETMNALNDKKYFKDSSVKKFNEVDKIKFNDDNRAKLKLKFKKTKGILTSSDSKAGVAEILGIEQPINNFNQLFKKIGIDLGWNSRAGRNKSVAEVVEEGKELSTSHTELSNNEKIIQNSNRVLTVEEVQQQADQFEDYAKKTASGERVNLFEDVASKIEQDGSLLDDFENIVSDTTKRFDGLLDYAKHNKKTAGAITLGLVALGSFLGYNAHRNSVSSYDEDSENYLGSIPGVTDFRQPNNLGYIYYNKKRER